MGSGRQLAKSVPRVRAAHGRPFGDLDAGTAHVARLWDHHLRGDAGGGRRTVRLCRGRR